MKTNTRLKIWFIDSVLKQGLEYLTKWYKLRDRPNNYVQSVFYNNRMYDCAAFWSERLDTWYLTISNHSVIDSEIIIGFYIDMPKKSDSKELIKNFEYTLKEYFYFKKQQPKQQQQRNEKATTFIGAGTTQG